ncbi:Hypothetical predicted protein, partial [Marmota monax]
MASSCLHLQRQERARGWARAAVLSDGSRHESREARLHHHAKPNGRCWSRAAKDH